MQNLKCLLILSSISYWAGCSGEPNTQSPFNSEGGVGGQAAGGGLASGGSSVGGQSPSASGGSNISTGGGTMNGVGGSRASAGGMTSGGIGGFNSGGGASLQAGGTGGAAVVAAGGSASDEEVETLEDGSPVLLSDTGLYVDDMVSLADGVRPFEPRFALWTDGATKKRWISLPEGSQIDTSDMDYWQFPTGARLFKEFSRDGVRVETRMLTKRERGGWQRVAYQWRDDQLEADAVIDGVLNASGTEHDIPSQEDCGTCHFRTTDKVLGFSALQLDWDNPDEEAWTLARLQEAGLVTVSSPSLELPGDENAQAALGYLHANCGHCHNPQSSVTTRVTVSFWLTVGGLASVEETPTYVSTVCKEIELQEGGVPGIETIVDPGSPETSSVFRRMESRGDDFAMPPLGTERVDMDGRDAVQAWILSLDGVVCP